jgi:GYD domain
MPIYISRGRFTSEAIKGMLAKPENRQEAVAKLFQSVGGKLISWYLTFGRHDWLAIDCDTRCCCGRQSVGYRDDRCYDSGRCCGHFRVCRKGRERLSERGALVGSSETCGPLKPRQNASTSPGQAQPRPPRPRRSYALRHRLPCVSLGPHVFQHSLEVRQSLFGQRQPVSKLFVTR